MSNISAYRNTPSNENILLLESEDGKGSETERSK